MAAKVPGTEGYDSIPDQFIEATLSIDFTELHRDFLPFIPQKSGKVLDLGAGIGRDASVLSSMGHAVTAVEPSEKLFEAGKNLYAHDAIHWIHDSLPDLKRLDADLKFDFILSSGVWHHLNPDEQQLSIIKVSELLAENGIFALSLRNGPAGGGSCVYPTYTDQTRHQAEQNGLKTLLLLENQPSLLPGKENVKWSRLVFQKSS
ncbi:class I SAM-dependent methyltransferase [Chryseobacterium sp. L7]|uniref:Class I SAM-dependent methyltransferase n=1 Tax=Chryseobacterium endalhagicum TaxID=2797638 RepID=A0ABS1QJ42_9FLAO|nr:class I SAM-dependent methyltransferase [Chryseobacterium endalhagicum]MBL1222652.1 class I SAM-dependent methyltransferase [Chryseobacterium endalhagicum]